MLIEPQRARDIKVELFEETTLALLQDSLSEWLELREEETVIGISFEADGSTSYIAFVLYTE